MFDRPATLMKHYEELLSGHRDCLPDPVGDGNLRAETKCLVRSNRSRFQKRNGPRDREPATVPSGVIRLDGEYEDGALRLSSRLLVSTLNLDDSKDREGRRRVHH